MSQEMLQRRLAAARANRTVNHIQKIEAFVSDRLDLPGMRLPSLQLISQRDIEMLAAAIDNC